MNSGNREWGLHNLFIFGVVGMERNPPIHHNSETPHSEFEREVFNVSFSLDKKKVKDFLNYEQMCIMPGAPLEGARGVGLSLFWTSSTWERLWFLVTCRARSPIWVLVRSGLGFIQFFWPIETFLSRLLINGETISVRRKYDSISESPSSQICVMFLTRPKNITAKDMAVCCQKPADPADLGGM